MTKLDELKVLRDNTKLELRRLEELIFELEKEEHDKMFISVRVEGCKGCELEYYGWNNSCDHCEGYHYEERLRSEYDK